MKLSYILSQLFCVALQLIHTLAIPTGNVANVYFIEKQRFLLEILHHVQEPLLIKQWQILGQKLVIDKSEYVLYNDEMRNFYKTFTMDRLVPRDIFYSPQHPEHYRQTLGLYNFFYNTREWSTLRQNICWARVHVNSGLFLHALTMVLLKREDYRPFIMPKIYELWPEIYHNEAIVYRARKFNFANWFTIQHSNDSQVLEILPKQLQPKSIRMIEKWSEAMADMHLLRLTNQKRELSQVKYLTEDIGWLAYWYYINMGITQTRESYLEQIHDWWYWQLKQILNRYKLELYGQQMDYVNLKEIQYPKATHLITWQNQRFHNELPDTKKWLKHLLDKLKVKVQMALETQHFILANGTEIDLKSKNNCFLALQELFPYDFSHLLTINAERPQLILELHTALRSDNFFNYLDKLLKLYQNFRSAFQMNYAHSSIWTNDFNIQKVDISPLITFDEQVDVDLSNLLHAQHFHYKGHFQWPFSLQLDQYRLQHRPFSISFQIFSNRTQVVALRLFLTTAKFGLAEPFYQLTNFIMTLQTGYNRLTKLSTEFPNLIDNHITLTELYQYVKLAELDTKYDFPLNISTQNCGFPRRLLLPHGGQHGKPLLMHFLVIATPVSDLKKFKTNELNCDFSNGINQLDNLPLDYPFESQLELFKKQIYWQQVEIYHKEGNE